MPDLSGAASVQSVRARSKKALKLNVRRFALAKGSARLDSALDHVVEASGKDRALKKALDRLVRLVEDAVESQTEQPHKARRPGPRKIDPSEASPGMAAALRGGQHFRQTEWAGPEMLSSKEAGQRINLSREALNNRRRSGDLLGLEAAKRGVRYPEWQFEDNVLPHVPEVLHKLGHLDPWGQYLFFTQPEPLLKGEPPLSVIRDGRAAEVVRVAGLLADEAMG
jgi:hypothetical protein